MMDDRKYKITIFLVLLFLVGIRLININMPILEGTAMRQTQTAMIARNFFSGGINMFYPRADFFGSGPGFLVLEFPLYNALAAVGYKMVGGVHEWVGRLITILFFAGGGLFLAGIVRRIFDKDTAIWSLAVFGLSPLSVIFSRTFMPDFEMIFFCLGALYFLIVACDKNKIKFYWLSSFFMMLAMLVKPHSFYIFLPLIYLIWKKESWKFLLNIRNWIYLAIAILPAVFWYIHGMNVHSLFTPEWSYNYEASNWFNPAYFTDVDQLKNILKVYTGIFLTPIGFTLLLFGLFIKTRSKENIIWFWLAGSVLFMIAFITHMEDPYYNLSILPIVSVFIARSIVFLKGLNWNSTVLKYKWGKALVILLILPFWIRYAGYAYIVPKGYRFIPQAGERIQEITQKDDLVIASSAGGVQALYFCDRKGWNLCISGIGEDKERLDSVLQEIETYREDGAAFYVCPVMDDFNGNRNFEKYMKSNFDIVEEKPGRYIIFSLRD